jgi:hypothetical protein
MMALGCLIGLPRMFDAANLGCREAVASRLSSHADLSPALRRRRRLLTALRMEPAAIDCQLRTPEHLDIADGGLAFQAGTRGCPFLLMHVKDSA